MSDLTPVNLREVYHELGEFEVRIVMSDELFSSYRDHQFLAIDSSGRRMQTRTRVWGNKIKCFFVIDGDVPDGVTTGQLIVNGHVTKTFYWWTVK